MSHTAYQWTLRHTPREPGETQQFLDLALDDDGDLLVRDGDLVLVGGDDYVVQEARVNLQWFRDEWFLDESKGVPFFEQIFVKNPNLPLIQATYRRALLATRGVVSVESLDLNLDKSTRTLTVNWSARITGGGIVSDSTAVSLAR